MAGVSRTDDNYTGRAGTRYLINRILSANLDFSYTKRNSSQAGNDFDRELIAARIDAQF